MKFVYQFRPNATNDWAGWIGDRCLADIAVAAELAGFDAVCSTDHPFPSASWLAHGGHHSFDPFVALSFMAAATSRIRLMTFVMVAGYRNPYLAAKSAASLDVLSGGRLVLGMGAGYQQPEFEALGASFADRGARADAVLRAMRAAWSGDVIERDDPHYPAHGNVALPVPLQRGGPPVWVGGNSKAAMRRVAELADGWLPFAQTAQMAAITRTPVLAVEDLADRIASISAARAELGRDPSFDVCFSLPRHRDIEATIADISNGVDDFARAGVTHLCIESRAVDAEASVAELGRCAEPVAAMA